jgi:rhodanese-related sulfurtransferase
MPPAQAVPRVPQLAPAAVRRLQVRGYPVMVVDIRPLEAFALRHVAGAFHFPLLQQPQLQRQLPRDRLLVLYADGAQGTVQAAEVLQALRRMGFRQAHLLKGGFAAWSAAGYPTLSAAADTLSSHESVPPNERLHYPWVPVP